MCERCEEHPDDPWVELAQHGLTREDQVEDYKDWLTRRRAALDQLEKKFEDLYPYRHPKHNHFQLDMLETGKFRLEMDEYNLDAFLDSRGIQGI